MEHFPITRYQTALTDSLMTILEMMERKNADKEAKWHVEEQCRRVEEREKEEQREKGTKTRRRRGERDMTGSIGKRLRNER